MEYFKVGTAKMYRLKLADNLYRLGGLEVTGTKEERKESILKLFAVVEEYFIDKDCKLIMKINSKWIRDILVKMGIMELSYSYAKKLYPEEIKAYVDQSPKSEYYYLDKTFVIRDKGVTN